MARANEMLSGMMVSGAGDRLAAKDKPSGKMGNPALTIKVRQEFDKVREEQDVSWEDWLAQHPEYGMGDNGHVYKK